MFGGEFKLYVYINVVEYAEHIALVKGDISAPGPVPVRMHAINVFDDLLGAKSGHTGLLHGAMELISKLERGVIVLIRDTKATIVSDILMRGRKGGVRELRDYGVGAQILVDLGVKELTLLSNTTNKHIIGLEGYGLKIADVMHITPKD
jgi:3,4-dihydroxy 2-butanone 4-phosphate synthase/GTP cyclohydrolase II